MNIITAFLIASIAAGQPVIPVNETPTPIYHLEKCPFCHEVYETKVDIDGDISYVKHKFVQFRVSNDTAILTCETIYAKYITVMGAIMVNDKAGMVKTVSAPVVKKPSASKHP